MNGASIKSLEFEHSKDGVYWLTLVHTNNTTSSYFSPAGTLNELAGVVMSQNCECEGHLIHPKETKVGKFAKIQT